MVNGIALDNTLSYKVDGVELRSKYRMNTEEATQIMIMKALNDKTTFEDLMKSARSDKEVVQHMDVHKKCPHYTFLCGWKCPQPRTFKCPADKYKR
jgi:hypothetical protein